MKRIFSSPVLLLPILLAGFILRLYHLGLDSLWYDETVSLVLARSDVVELLRHTAADIHPPLYYLLLHFWGQVAGWSEFSAAFFSLWFGLLLIALVYRVARDLVGARVAFLAALLVALSPYNIWYSQEVRMYTLGAALGLVSCYWLWRMMQGQDSILSSKSIGYGLATVLGLYTLYYFVFLIAFQYLAVAVWFVGHLRAGGTNAKSPGDASGLKRLASFAISQLLIFVFYLPWLPIAFRQATDPPVPPWRSFTPPGDALLQSFSALVLGESMDWQTVWPILLVALALIAALFVFASRTAPRRGGPQTHPNKDIPVALTLLAYTFAPVALIILLSLRTPLFHPRYIFTYSPAFYILLALSAVTVSRAVGQWTARAAPAFAAAILIVLALASAFSLDRFWSDPQYAADDLRGAVAHIAENWRPGDAILVDAGYAYTALAYYYPTPLGARVRLSDYAPRAGDDQAPLVLLSGSIGGSPRLGWGDPRSDFYTTSREATTRGLDAVFQTHSRVWVLRIYDTVTDPDGVIRQYLAEHGQLIEDSGYTGQSNLRVMGFITQMPAELPSAATRSGARLADRVALLGYTPIPAAATSRGMIDVVLYWQALQSLNHNYQLSVQVLSSDGSSIAQHDEKPLGESLPMTRWKTGVIYPEPVRVQLPDHLSPGHYTVIAKVYSLETGEVLGEPIELGAFYSRY